MSTAAVERPRQVARKFLARPQHEGVGAVVRRSIGRFELRYFDPFLVLDEFSVSAPAGFPDHPHRGFETVTYMLECVASHPDTRIPFLNAHIPLYLYPFLNTTSKTRPFEYLRLTSLGVIGALVKVDDSEVIGFLLQTEIIPLCLRTMEMGSELSKTVATFIVQKILLDDIGLRYICATAERFFAVATVLAQMVQALAEQPSARLLKHIIRCYLRLTENARACAALNSCLPTVLKDGTFNSFLQQDDHVTRRWLQQLLHNMTIAGMGGGSSHAGGMGVGGPAGMGGGSSHSGMGGGGPHAGLDHLMGL